MEMFRHYYIDLDIHDASFDAIYLLRLDWHIHILIYTTTSYNHKQGGLSNFSPGLLVYFKYPSILEYSTYTYILHLSSIYSISSIYPLYIYPLQRTILIPSGGLASHTTLFFLISHFSVHLSNPQSALKKTCLPGQTSLSKFFFPHFFFFFLKTKSFPAHTDQQISLKNFFKFRKLFKTFSLLFFVDNKILN